MRYVCKTISVAGQCDVELIQTGFNRFTVVYGQQVQEKLNYGEAAKELGECIMHALACAGRIDNRSKQEAAKDGDRKPYFTE